MPSLRLLVVGASQGTGALTVSAALERGHQVTAFARSADKLAMEHPLLTKVAGSFHDAAAVDAAAAAREGLITSQEAVATHILLQLIAPRRARGASFVFDAASTGSSTYQPATINTSPKSRTGPSGKASSPIAPRMRSNASPTISAP
jgi:uncharacterized protein YbjT (DUF2867 family)